MFAAEPQVAGLRNGMFRYRRRDVGTIGQLVVCQKVVNLMLIKAGQFQIEIEIPKFFKFRSKKRGGRL